MTSLNLTIPGYSITEELYTGSRTLVYRGIRQSDRQPVALKLMRNNHPRFSEIVQFCNQYAIALRLSGSNTQISNDRHIIQPYSLEPYHNSYVLVMEDFGGISLAKYLQALQDREIPSLSLLEFSAIALQLTNILDTLYQHRVIHKDIKPANILIHPQTQQIKLIDFSISSLLPKETQEIQNPNALEGTLVYMSPEQTGRMNRGIDYRSDFYALGVTFYELLAGQLPFPYDDPMELVHCHIAKQPPLVHEIKPDVPIMLSEIVSKLMAKNAEDRYQSAQGLKYDLQQCLEQWQSNGRIKPFSLGQRDISGHFIIPEKLYGRHTEVATLLAAFNRVSQGTTEMMLVSGFSGIGKTAVVNEIHKPIVRQRGYFIQGKFDQFQRNIPFSAFVQTFRDLMRQLLTETDAYLQQWKAQILEALGENAQVMIEVVPELELIIGKQPPVRELSGTAAQSRFNLLFHKFIQIFATSEHPLAIFLDDLQWADSASLKLTELLLSETDTRYLFLIGAYRDNEVSPTHPLMVTLTDLQKGAVTMHTIRLAPLDEGDINQLIADTLSCTPARAQPLAELVYQKTQGNPFFANQFLKALHEEGLIVFDLAMRCWQCDIAKVRSLALTDNVVEFMALQLRKLPETTQSVLKLAACIGNQFDLATLAIVSEQAQPDAATALWQALQEGLVLPTSKLYKFFQSQADTDALTTVSHVESCSYKFLHDRVQQAAYSLIPEAEKQATHLKIGRLLLSNTSAEEQTEKIFAIVNQLNIGIHLITDETEKLALARLNLVAGHKAKASTAYDAAVRYLKTGLSLLPGHCWISQYHLALGLHIETAEAEYLNINFEQAKELADIALQNTANLLDRVQVYELQMQICIAQLQMVQAVEIGLNVLEQLGVTLVNLEDESQSKIVLPDLSDLARMPVITDPYQLAAMQMMKNLCAPVFMAKPEIFPQIILTMINLCLKQGNSAIAAFAYGFYGLLQVGIGQLDEGYKAGNISLNLLDQFNAKELKAKVYNLFNSNIRTWKEHAINSVNPLKEGVQSGLETGDLEWGGYCAGNLSSYFFFTDKSLESAIEQQAIYIDLSLKIKQDISSLFSKVWRQLGLNLQGLATERHLLIGESFDEAEIVPRLIEAKSGTTLFIFYVAKTILLYHCQQYKQAIAQVTLAQEQMGAAFGFIQVVVLNFYHSLALLADYDQVEPAQQLSYLEEVTANQKQMQFWAQHAPMNNQHRYELVEAEKARVLGQYWEATKLYDRAIAGAKTNQYIAEMAIANELAAKFYLEHSKEKIAQVYLIEAYYAYARWGAKAKIDDLENDYPQLLALILQQPQLTNFSESLVSSGHSQPSLHFTRQTIHSDGTSTASVLDLMTAIKVSQALSSEIELDKLLATFMQVVMENAGADKCALLLPKSGTWMIEAIAQSSTDPTQPTIRQSLSLEDSLELPIGVVNYVKRTQKTLTIQDATTEPKLVADPYIVQRQPKSVLCSPILHQGTLIGILYLENSLAIGAFTQNHVEVLNLLCTQAAISLENARLYQQSQQALEDLKQAQLQLVQSEKMSALGNLVAGVAHEINNPVGFIAGNLFPAKDYVQDLFGLLDLYQQKFPHPGEEIEAEIDSIDLDYLREDLPSLLDSMQVGVDRICNISSSLRTFSRADKAYKVPFEIHDGIDSTILILKHRLKGNEQRPAIAIIKNYGKLPQVQCFPGQLNQVFMNVLANAIDAFDDMNQGRSFEEIEQNANRIEIETQVDESGQHVTIYIRDNGPGMSAEVKEHIFDHLFTTKVVGKGTGLGLAIVRQIVVEAHGGRLTVDSELGKGAEFAIALPIHSSTP